MSRPTGWTRARSSSSAALIRGLAAHCAVIVTSHILSEIERVADRVAILLDGRLLAVVRIDDDRRRRLRSGTDLSRADLGNG